MLEVQRQIARGIHEDGEPDPGRKQRVQGREPVEGDLKTHVPARHPADLHGAPASEPAPERRPEGEEGEGGPDLRREAGPQNPGEQGGGRSHKGKGKRQQDGERCQRRASRLTLCPPAAIRRTG